MLSISDIMAIKNLIISAGKVALQYHGKELMIETKSDNSPVTNVDKLLSSQITSTLKILTPNIPVISEEDEFIPNTSEGTFWLVDPIDGTKSFIRGDDTYTVNIGLVENLTPTYGFIYQPSERLLHYTDADKKLVVERNGEDITTKLVKQLVNRSNKKIAISSEAVGEQIENFIRANNVGEILSVPSSLKLCLVADGSVDFYPRFSKTMEWDIAAGHAIIKAGGGDVTCLNGSPFMYGKPGLVNSFFIAYGSSAISDLIKES